MKKNGFKQVLADHTVFYKKEGDDIMLPIYLYWWHIVAGSDISELEKLQNYVAKKFEIRTWTLKYFLGIEVSQFNQRLFLSQQKYILDLLTEIDNSACKPVDTLIKMNHGLAF